MAITLQTYASGDLDYVSKMNSNVATIEAALNALQSVAPGGGGGTGEGVPVGYWDALFGSQTTLIGVGSYAATSLGTGVSIAGGACYKASTQEILSTTSTTLSLIGQVAGTYYVIPGGTGAPELAQVSTDALYQIEWSGSAITSLTRYARALMNAVEESNARVSTVSDATYATLDDRLEAIETNVSAVLDSPAAASRVRKVGIALDGGALYLTEGVKGAIQVDFAGTIIGWSCIANEVGDLQVEVSLARSSPPAVPPDDPPIPDPVTDKISASAPVELSYQQSASAGIDEVSTWTTDVEEWDVIQFKVLAGATVKSATLYLRVVEYSMTSP